MTQKIIFSCFIISCLSSCLNPDDIYLTEKQKKERIEMEYQTAYKRLEPLIEKGCEERFQKAVNKTVDSLVNVYLDSTKYDY